MPAKLGYTVSEDRYRHHQAISNEARLLKSRFLAREDIFRKAARFASSWIVLHELSEIQHLRRFLRAMNRL